ncbi:TIGR02281 family clan AA aspartic protease [Sphingorhabdus sp. Alg239-R122]|uniref:retropepsin-like aspartic protease family protein n=1 Tax=Sphingorhabdus sp. Alg239-R122 TaxID=2305989 RepID=UPI0013DADF07|nr:TIGR02281 family clan AA aspartic protease [Sphingorhabdus sp. Alg239-R122]
MGGDNYSLVFNAILLVGVIAMFFTFRVSAKDTVKMIAAWIGIFALALLVFSFRGEFLTVWDRVKTETIGHDRQDVVGKALVLRQSEGGHFYVTGKVNGQETLFMVDSGATQTAFSRTEAERLGLDIDTMFAIPISTANGESSAWRARIDKLELETLVTNDHAVLVVDTMMDENLLGMNFLSRLESWRVEGDRMILVPKGTSETRSDMTK